MERRVVVICAVVGILGLLSVILGFVAEATKIKISQVTSIGFSCVRPHSPATALAQLCFVFSWITVVIAAVVLLLASSYNSYNSNSRCYVTKPGVFAGGAILCLVSVVLGLASYILSLQKNSNKRFQGDIAMAQPQFAGGTSIYQGATPIGQPQYQWGNPAVHAHGTY
ncbi:hypothetical protein CMV_024002 [Castanea mollissima]|uniref:Uncharacterized protein n=1 Tax=Castanea mollissima TaxID=60419 RepID=A0A8J4QS74_9ROSI|nr:hypothetical protein CMV_024002 [Castanea mollissima]